MRPTNVIFLKRIQLDALPSRIYEYSFHNWNLKDVNNCNDFNEYMYEKVPTFDLYRLLFSRVAKHKSSVFQLTWPTIRFWHWPLTILYMLIFFDRSRFMPGETYIFNQSSFANKPNAWKNDCVIGWQILFLTSSCIYGRNRVLTDNINI